MFLWEMLKIEIVLKKSRCVVIYYKTARRKKFNAHVDDVINIQNNIYIRYIRFYVHMYIKIDYIYTCHMGTHRILIRNYIDRPRINKQFFSIIMTIIFFDRQQRILYKHENTTVTLKICIRRN